VYGAADLLALARATWKKMTDEEKLPFKALAMAQAVNTEQPGELGIQVCYENDAFEDEGPEDEDEDEGPEDEGDSDAEPGEGEPPYPLELQSQEPDAEPESAFSDPLEPQSEEPEAEPSTAVNVIPTSHCRSNTGSARCLAPQIEWSYMVLISTLNT
jgi:hypothetical protein